MGDIVFVIVTIAFFALCLLYVRGCELLVRSGEESPEGDRGDAVTADNIIGLILAVLLTGYLVAALLLPERF